MQTCTRVCVWSRDLVRGSRGFLDRTKTEMSDSSEQCSLKKVTCMPIVHHDS